MARSVHVKLAAHPANPARFHQRIDATLTHGADGSLAIGYAVQGLNLDLRVPTPHAPAPADALWKTTCCEVFLGIPGRAGYREFNFSTSGQWAGYDFIDTRQRAPAPCDCPAPRLACERSEDLLILTATLPPAALPPATALRIGVAAILAANDGSLGYWALAHPPGQPDFHHHAGFVLSLGAQGFRPTQWP
jgi:hypothetical protein